VVCKASYCDAEEGPVTPLARSATEGSGDEAEDEEEDGVHSGRSEECLQLVVVIALLDLVLEILLAQETNEGASTGQDDEQIHKEPQTSTDTTSL